MARGNEVVVMVWYRGSLLRSGFRTAIPAPGLVLLAIGLSLAGCSRRDVPTAAEIRTGSLALTLSGLPAGGSAAIAVSGPNGFSRRVDSSEVLVDLVPGNYQLMASDVTVAGSVFAPSTSSLTVRVARGALPATASIAFSLITGALSIAVGGLPQGAQPAIAVTGPGGYTASLSAATTLTGLMPGTYTVVAGAVTSGEDRYAAAAPIVATVSALPDPTPVDIAYLLATGRLAVTVQGLPAGLNAAVSVTGPNEYSRQVVASTVLGGLSPGRYDVGAAPVSGAGGTFQPATASQSVVVAASSTPASAAVTYLPPAPGPDLRIEGLHITQVVQTTQGSVPLVAGRSGLLRVFVTSSEANSARPEVRVRLYVGGELMNTLSIAAPASSVPTSVNEGTLTSTWNAVIPGAWVQPGLALVADLDPANAYAEPNESNNVFPSFGMLAVDIRGVPPLALRVVPVVQAVNGLAGNVSEASKDAFTSLLRKLHPLRDVTVEIRPAYTTSAGALQRDNANSAWIHVLNEISALRVSEGSTAYYYGVVQTSYSSGVAGIGYLPGSSALGWDRLPSGAEVMAHELGHNFGRQHAPCGNPGGVDDLYPHALGNIGAFGYDTAAAVLIPPTASDVMGYCRNPWVSDYTYVGILNYRATRATTSPAVARATTPQPGVLVWGRIQGGRPSLEPAYAVDAPPALPPRGGANLLEGFGAGGEPLFSLSFEGEPIADAGAPGDRTFAFVIPQSILDGRGLARLRLTAAGRRAELQAAGAPAEPVIRTAATTPSATRARRDAVRVRWSDPSIRGVMVRDPRTGQILSFSRERDALVRTASPTVELIVSDGVRSQKVSVTPR